MAASRARAFGGDLAGVVVAAVWRGCGHAFVRPCFLRLAVPAGSFVDLDRYAEPAAFAGAAAAAAANSAEVLAVTVLLAALSGSIFFSRR